MRVRVPPPVLLAALERCRGPWVVPAAVFLVAAVLLAALCSRVADWAVMTDELLYERLAISFADGSLLPTLHGERVDVFAVLYPLLLAPVFAVVDLPDAVRVAHGLNGVLLASAAVPTYLLARELRLGRLSLLAASLFAVAVPWTVIGGFVMTEAAAYPAALWAFLAIQRAVVSPSPRRDAVALGAIGLASLARPHLAALGLVLVLAVLLHETRFRRWREHVLVLAVAIAALLVLALSGGGVLGSYAPVLAEGELLSVDAVRLAVEHVNVTAVAVGLVPLLLGGGWAVAALVRPSAAAERLGFAATASSAVVVLALVAGSVVERFGLGLEVKDRYFFYVAPLLFLATACAVDDARPRVVGVLALTAIFVLTVGLEDFAPVFGVNVDSPASSTHEAMTRLGNELGVAPAELMSIVGGLLGAALFLALRRPRRRALAPVVLGGVLAFVVAESAYTWDRLFASSGPSGRPLASAQPPQLSWIDAAVPAGSVAMLPYSVGQEWYPSAVAWWDTEFWNARVDRAYMLGGYFTYTPESFPRARLSVDPRSGLIEQRAPDYVVRTTLDARLRPAGIAAAVGSEFELIDVAIPFRAEWLTLGLDPDGWTRLGRRAFLRIFPPTGGVVVTLTLNAPEVDEPLGVAVGPITLRLGPTESREISFQTCVGERGYVDTEITTTAFTTVRAVATTPPYSSRFRKVGVRLSRIQAVPTGLACQT